MRSIYQTFSPFFSNRTPNFNPGAVHMGLVVDNAGLDMFFLDFILTGHVLLQFFCTGHSFSIFCTGYVLRFLCTRHVLHQLFALDIFFFDFCVFFINVFALEMFFLFFFFYTRHVLRLIWQLPFLHCSITICHEALKHTNICSLRECYIHI